MKDATMTDNKTIGRRAFLDYEIVRRCGRFNMNSRKVRETLLGLGKEQYAYLKGNYDSLYKLYITPDVDKELKEAR